MGVVSLTDNQSRTQFFHETVLLNLEYWQSWLAETNETDLEALDGERDSIVRAILFAFELGLATWSPAYRLMTTFSPYMERRGYWDVWNSVLGRAVQTAAEVGDEAGAVNLSALLARLLFQQSRLNEARRYYRQTIRLARQTGDKFNEARACSNLGYDYTENGQWYRAEVLCCHALKIFEQLDSNHGRAHTENHLGFLYSWQHRWGQARQHLERACAIWQAMKDKHGLMRGLINLGGLYLRMEQPDNALVCLEEALAKAQSTGEEMIVGRIYTNLGMAYRLKGNFGASETHFKQAEMIFQRSSNLKELARVWNDWGLAYCQQHKWQEAMLLLENSLEMWRNLGNNVQKIEVLLDMTECELARGNHRAASSRLKQIEDRLGQVPKDARRRHFQPRLDKYRSLLGSQANKLR